MKWLRAIGGITLAVGLVVGWKLYRKFDTAKQVRNTLLSVCADDQQCVGAVEQHFDACFDAHYDLGGRRRVGRLMGDPFTECLLDKSGVPALPDPS